MKEISKQEYKEFFKWLFGENIEIKEEFDINMASDYYDPNIYYTKEIYDLFQTKAMQRLAKINHLGGFILLDSNVYHNRLEHSKGAYRRCIEFLATQYKNDEWKKYIEENKQKGYLVDKIKFMCTHDIGHSMLSHGIEKLVGDENCTHEDIGDRIRKEDKQLKQALENIKADETQSNIGDGSLEFLCEGNIDFDRCDFLTRDLLYTGEENQININEIINRLNHSCTLEELENGQMAYVYNLDAIRDIENFLKFREAMYEKQYRSKEKAKVEYYLRIVLDKIIKSDNPSDIKSMMANIYNKNINQIDISKYLQTDDIKLFNGLIKLIDQTEDNDLKEEIGVVLPEPQNAFNLAVNMLDPKNRKEDYKKEEKEFINNIRRLLDNDTLYKSNIYDYIVAFESDKDEILSLDFKSDAIEKYKKKFKIYSPKKPIYIKDHEGRIVTLENHPDLSIDLLPKYRYGVYIFIKDLQRQGYSKLKINEICNQFSKYDDDCKKQTNKRSYLTGKNIDDFFGDER